MAMEYEIIGKNISLKQLPFPYPSYKVKSPRNDVKELAYSLMALLRKDTPREYLKYAWRTSDNKKITTSKFDVNFFFLYYTC